MALRDKLAGFIDNIGLKEVFETKPRDPVKARQTLLRGIDKTREQISEGKTKVPHRWWSASNNVVAFSPKLSGVPLVINGQTTNHIPAERINDFLDAFKAAVEAGEFDDEIEQIEKGGDNAGQSVAVRPRKARGTGKAKYPADHPANTDPEAWANMTKGGRIKAGLAYKNK